MCEDLQVPITLAIADCKTDLRVIGFTGRDALNEAYTFDIKLIGSDPHLDAHGVLHRTAFLSFGRADEGVHGQICQFTRIHCGACVSLYHLVLKPTLVKLAQRPQRRIHHDITVPQLILQQLARHAIEANACRFGLMTGLYPSSPLRIQYDETDLQLLQRLCEEEGIHFRFEHEPTGHRLVFSDDAASFPVQRMPIRFRRSDEADSTQATLLHMAEILTMPLASAHDRDCRKELPSPGSAPDMSIPAANQPFGSTAFPGPISEEQALDRQHGIRRLERLRCERREVSGHTRQTALRSGEVMQVLDHPEPLFNDQWLLTEVIHTGRQLQVLRDADPDDTRAILKAMLNEPRLPFQTKHAGNGYRNSFKAIPWTMPFRPSIKHPRPAATGDHIATVQEDDACAPRHGVRSIRFDWQPAPKPGSHPRPWPRAQVASDDMLRLAPGTRVLVRYLDNHPDRPVICAALAPAECLAGIHLRLDDSDIAPIDPIHLASGQHLHATTSKRLIVRSQAATLHVDPQHILITGPVLITTSLTASTTLATPPTMDDLRLTGQPGRQDEPLADRVWYIVRMETPGLQYLPRVAAENILFEGRTDPRGYLGLSQAQRQRLANEYRQTPQMLCLIHPGHCLPLHAWFEQNLKQEQRDAIGINSP